MSGCLENNSYTDISCLKSRIPSDLCRTGSKVVALTKNRRVTVYCIVAIVHKWSLASNKTAFLQHLGTWNVIQGAELLHVSRFHRNNIQINWSLPALSKSEPDSFPQSPFQPKLFFMLLGWQKKIITRAVHTAHIKVFWTFNVGIWGLAIYLSRQCWLHINSSVLPTPWRSHVSNCCSLCWHDCHSYVHNTDTNLDTKSLILKNPLSYNQPLHREV